MTRRPAMRWRNGGAPTTARPSTRRAPTSPRCRPKCRRNTGATCRRRTLIPGLLAEAEGRAAHMVEAPPTAPRSAKGIDMPKHDDEPSGFPQPHRRAQGGRRIASAARSTRTRRRPCSAKARRMRGWCSSASSRAIRRICRASRSSARPGRCSTARSPKPASTVSCVYVTNAVKHFKFEPRGKRRIHKKPDNNEIEACRWWLDNELRAARSRSSPWRSARPRRARSPAATSTISRSRGQLMTLRDGVEGFITVHPSFLLRLPDEAAKAREYAKFVRRPEAGGRSTCRRCARRREPSSS